MTLPVYEFYVALGVVSGFTLLYFLNKRIAVPLFETTRGYFYFILGCVVSGTWGARVLGDVIVQPNLSFESWSLVFLDRPSGPVVFYGGLLALFYFLFLVARFRRISFGALLDFAVPALSLGHGIGRLGCWTRGCCHGDLCPYFWGVSPSAGAPPLHPVQLYESFFLLALAYISTRKLLPLQRETAAAWLLKLPRNSVLYLIAYPSFRFVNEFFRGDVGRGFWGPLSTSQWISLGLLGFGFYLGLRERQNKRGATLQTN